MGMEKHINKRKFFAAAKPIFGSYSQEQVDGLNHIIDEQARRKFFVWDQFAYMLATTWLETAHKMQPIREMGGEDYLRKKKYYPWVGEGLVQVTWEDNAKKFGAKKPGDLLTWPIALEALFKGMLQGMFTKRKLDDYFHGPENARVQDWKNARQIINPKDYKTYETIGKVAEAFYAAIIRSLEDEGEIPDASKNPVVPVEAPKTTTVPTDAVKPEAEKPAPSEPTPEIPAQPPARPSLLSRIFANFDLHLFRS
jgi:putative chitinase